MNVEIRRRLDWETNRSVCGEMWLDGVFECFTLEPARINPVHAGHPCIAAGGPFKVILSMSPHLGYVTPEVLNVPGRTAIRWHIANKPEDVLGCTGVGTVHMTDWVGNSKVAFKALMVKLQGQDILATYIDNWNLDVKSTTEVPV
jgi:hypothetical protein